MIKNLSKLDLAFVMDTTSSMGPYIENAKKNITTIAETIIRQENCSMLRLGLVNYRDHPPQDNTYITQINDLTSDFEASKKFINESYPAGGGDEPEAICCALYDCINKLSWSEDSIKVAVLITDAPCHGLHSSSDGFANGCPLKNDPVEIAHKMAEKGITLYACGCEPSLTRYRQFFVALCLITGGQYVPLNDAENLTQMIVGGTREEISMEKLMAQVNEEVMRDAAEKGTRVNEEELTKRIHHLLNSKLDNKINKLNHVETIEITDDIREASKLKSLKEMADFCISKSMIKEEPYVLNFTTSLFGRGKTGKRTARKAKEKKLTKPAKRTIYERDAKKSSIYSGDPVKRKSPRLNKENESIEIKKPGETNLDHLSTHNIAIEDARRMVKKAIARNKLDSI